MNGQITRFSDPADGQYFALACRGTRFSGLQRTGASTVIHYSPKICCLVNPCVPWGHRLVCLIASLFCKLSLLIVLYSPLIIGAMAILMQPKFSQSNLASLYLSDPRERVTFFFIHWYLVSLSSKITS